MGFIEAHGLWSADDHARAGEVLERITREGIELVRFSFPDLHGILRGKALTALAVEGTLRGGVSITSSLLMKDTSHRTAVPIFTAGAGIGDGQVQGAGDVIMVPDPATFRVLPWADRTGFMLCDLYHADGTPVAYATRGIARAASRLLAERGRHLVCGLEVEFHLFRLTSPHLGIDEGGQPGHPPDVALLHQGYNYLTDQRFDQLSPIVDILRRDIAALGLPLTSVEVEFGPSQCEFVFKACPGFQAADDMVLLRSAVKQISHRHGYHATFMCRPAFANAMSSGWHLHQSLCDDAGANVFARADGAPGLSDEGLAYVAGLLAQARDIAAFAAPTVNAYKRYRTNSLAPDRIAWGRDNRGAMLRVIDRMGASATRVENRVGEPAANPYLYIASQALAGIDGIDAGLAAPAPVDTPYEAVAERLPGSLEEAVTLLDRSTFARTALGNDFIDYFVRIKRFEIDRFNAAVTDWEHREYFEAF